MSDREVIFSAIRKALEPIEEPAAYPDWNTRITDSNFAKSEKDNLELFIQQLQAAKGVYLDSWDALADFLRKNEATCGYVDPLFMDAENVLEEFQLEEVIDRDRIDEYSFGITCASGAIAESGTIIIGDTDCAYRLAALAPWIHIAVVPKESIVRTVAEAISLFSEDPSIIFATGPSKTADIEGILIQGVHGPGIQACLVV